jgi:uncharacterized protein YjiS (DUF1127 family)
LDQCLRKLAIDALVPYLVGIRQIAARYIASDAQMIELGRLRPKTGLDIAQAFPIGQLRKSHAQKLVEAAERAGIEIASILRDQSTKRMPRSNLHHLSEHELSDMHGNLPELAGKPASFGTRLSNRLHRKSLQKIRRINNLLRQHHKRVGR